MLETARAAVLTALKRLAMRPCGLLTVGPDAPLARIEACGSCGTDYERYDGEDSPPCPTIPGHEPLGVMVDIGALARQRWRVSVREEDQALHSAIVSRQGIR